MAELTPDEILTHMRQVYATCRTYQDRGVVVAKSVHPENGGRRLSERRTFSTAFVRPDRFRFEWAEPTVGPEDEWERMVILWNDAGVRSWWTIQPGIERYESIHDAVSGAAGVSGGSAYIIPNLLVPGGKGADPLPAPDEVSLRGRDSLAGRPCFVLELAHQSLWIGCDDFLLRRDCRELVFDASEVRRLIEEDLGSADERERGLRKRALEHFDRSSPQPFRTESIIDYEPVLDAPIEPERFVAPGAWTDPPANELTRGVSSALQITPIPSGGPAASSVLSQVRRLYSSCRSYRDMGTMTRVSWDEHSRRRCKETRPFSTAFLRPERFRFEFSRPDDDDLGMFLLWNDEGLRSWSSIRPGVRRYETLLDALGHAAAISSGTAGLVPCLLFGWGDERDPFPSETSTEILGTETIADHDCLVLRGNHSRGDEVTLWIDRSDLLLRRIEEGHVSDESSRLRTLTTMKKRLEASLDEKETRDLRRAIEHFSEPRPSYRIETTFTFEPELDPVLTQDLFTLPEAWQEP